MHGNCERWTKEQIDTMRSLRNQGFACSYIALQIKKSKGAVIGKCARLGIHVPGDVELKRKPRKKVEGKGPPGFGKKGRQQNPRTTQKIPNELVTRQYEPLGKPKRIEQLAAGDCRWPCGDPKDPAFRFCGATAKEGKPYCAHHAKIAYNSEA